MPFLKTYDIFVPYFLSLPWIFTLLMLKNKLIDHEAFVIPQAKITSSLITVFTTEK